jgi:spore coat protein SA
VINLKIALICTEKLPVPCVAGGAIQQYIDGILPYLSAKHDITVYSVEHPSLSAYDEKNNVKYVRVPGVKADDYIANVKKVITNNFDLIHVFNRPLWVLSLSEILPNTRISLSLHNEMFHPEKIPNIKGAECVKRVEFINTVSKFIADGVKTLYPSAANKLNVVYSAADIDRYKPNWTAEGNKKKNMLKEKYNLRNYRVVLSVGRLSEKKGTHVLINAVKKLMDYRRDIALFVVGSKWYGSNKEDDYTKSLSALSRTLAGPIIFTGFIPPSEIPDYYNIGDVFVCCSQWNEPLARVHYEAMAAGLPIITTNRGGNAEVVSGLNNGIVIDDYKNPDAFTNNINYLLNNPFSSEQMGRSGRALIESRFNWKRVADDILNAFSKVK